MLEHDEGGSVGVVLNRPTDTPVDDVVPRWGLVVASPPLLFGGGPVSVNGAICLARAIGDLPHPAEQAQFDDLRDALGDSLGETLGRDFGDELGDTSEEHGDGETDREEKASFQVLVGSVGTVDLHRSPEEVPVRLAEARVFAGYAGWSAGQLESEIEERAWLVVEALESDIFDTDPAGLWVRVLRRQGGWLAVLGRHPIDPSVN